MNKGILSVGDKIFHLRNLRCFLRFRLPAFPRLRRASFCRESSQQSGFKGRSRGEICRSRAAKGIGNRRFVGCRPKRRKIKCYNLKTFPRSRAARGKATGRRDSRASRSPQRACFPCLFPRRTFPRAKMLSKNRSIRLTPRAAIRGLSLKNGKAKSNERKENPYAPRGRNSQRNNRRFGNFTISPCGGNGHSARADFGHYSRTQRHNARDSVAPFGVSRFFLRILVEPATP